MSNRGRFAFWDPTRLDEWNDAVVANDPCSVLAHNAAVIACGFFHDVLGAPERVHQSSDPDVMSFPTAAVPTGAGIVQAPRIGLFPAPPEWRDVATSHAPDTLESYRAVFGLALEQIAVVLGRTFRFEASRIIPPSGDVNPLRDYTIGSIATGTFTAPSAVLVHGDAGDAVIIPQGATATADTRLVREDTHQVTTYPAVITAASELAFRTSKWICTGERLPAGAHESDAHTIAAALDLARVRLGADRRGREFAAIAVPLFAAPALALALGSK